MLLFQRIAVFAPSIAPGADESLHLLRTLNWLGRAELTGDGAHRMRGISVLLLPFAAITDRFEVYRVVFAILGLAACWVTYLIGREFLGRWVALWSALMLGLWSAATYTSVQVLPDLPAALLVFVALLLYWRAAVSVPPNRPASGLVPVGLLLGAAFWFNLAYPALGAVVIGLHFLLWRPREVLHRPFLLAFAGLGTVLAPYFVGVWVDHGSPLATLRIGLRNSGELGGSLPGRDPGYITYVRWFFNEGRLFPAIATIALIACAGVLALAVLTGRLIPRRHASLLALWLVIPASAMGLLFHAEERYIWIGYPAFFLTFGVGAFAVVRALRRAPSVAVVGLIAVASVFGASQTGIADDRAAKLAENQGLIAASARELAKVAKPPCMVWTRYARQFTLLSECRAARYGGATPETIDRFAKGFDGETYLALFSGGDGTPRQPIFLGDFGMKKGKLVVRVTGKGWLGIGTVYLYTG